MYEKNEKISDKFCATANVSKLRLFPRSTVRSHPATAKVKRAEREQPVSVSTKSSKQQHLS